MSNKSKGEEFKEVAGELMGFKNNQIVNTIKGLTLRPGIVIESFLRGEREKFLSPVIYFFSLLTIEYIVTTLTGYRDFYLEVQLLQVQEAFGDQESLSEVEIEFVVDRMGAFIQFILSEMGQKLLMLPIMLLLVSLIYINQKKGFKGNSWLALYAFGHVKLLTIPFTFLWLVGVPLFYIGLISFIVSILYWIYASKAFYNLSALRAIFMGLLFYLSYLLIFTFIGGLAGAYIGFTAVFD